MNKLCLVLLLAVLFTSCKKDPGDVPGNKLPEQTTLNVGYGTEPDQKMDMYLPAGRTFDSTKVIVLIHGGAWASGDKADFTGSVSLIKQYLPGYAIFNLNYRLATFTSNRFPTQENDIKTAINFIVSRATEYKINPNKLVLLGASAGGHLSLLQAYKNSTPKIAAVVDFFGPTEMAGLYNSFDNTDKILLQALVGGTPTSHPALYQEASPINYVSAQSPPTIMLHGTLDDLVPISQSTALKAKLDAFGIKNELVVYPTEGHGWTGAKMTDSFVKIAAFLLTTVQ